MEAQGSARRTPRIPTPLAVLLIAGWLGLAVWGAAVLLLTGGLSVGVFFGDPPTSENWTEGILFSVAGVIVAVAGPMGIWFFHRHRGWLVAAGVIGVITGLAAVAILLTFSAT